MEEIKKVDQKDNENDKIIIIKYILLYIKWEKSMAH